MARAFGQNHEPSEEQRLHDIPALLAQAQLLATVLGQKARAFFIEAQLLGNGPWTQITSLLYRGTAPGNGPWTKIPNLLYRGTASGNGPWTKSRSFFIEAQRLVILCGHFSYFTAPGHNLRAAGTGSEALQGLGGLGGPWGTLGYPEGPKSSLKTDQKNHEASL